MVLPRFAVNYVDLPRDRCRIQSLMRQLAEICLRFAGIIRKNPGQLGQAIHFHREAGSLEEAIRSAIGDVRSAGFDVARVEMEPDAVSQST